MRTLVYILISLMMGVLTTNAQETTSIEQSEDTSISISVDGDISFSGKENTYFSTSDSDETYKVRTKFNNRKTAKIRSYLLEELGKDEMKTSGSKSNWRVSYNGATGYEVKIDEGSLRIFVDKELVSSSVFNKFKKITKNIKEYTSGKSQEKREAEKTQREQEHLTREAEQKMREAEGLQREAERLKREAERLKREAKRKENQ